MILSWILPLILLYATFLTASSARDVYQHEWDIRNVLEMLRNRELIFLGDSLTRYQYLNFVDFQHTGQWMSRPPYSESERQWSKTKGNWPLFLKMTNLRLGGNEICDCYRDPAHPLDIVGPVGVKENRHYLDLRYNISVKFLWWTGYQFIMSKMPEKFDFENIDNSLDNWIFSDTKFTPKFDYKYDTLEDLLYEQIKPRYPDFLVFNVGIWDSSTELQNMRNNPKEYAGLLKESARFPIWKRTTTKRSESADRDDPHMLEVFHNESIITFDAYSLTVPFSVDPNNYDDANHFKPFVYAVTERESSFSTEGFTGIYLQYCP